MKLKKVKRMTAAMTTRLTSSVVGVTAVKKAADGHVLALLMVPLMT